MFTHWFVHSLPIGAEWVWQQHNSKHGPGRRSAMPTRAQPGTETKLVGWRQRLSWTKVWNVLSCTTGTLLMRGQWHRISGPWSSGASPTARRSLAIWFWIRHLATGDSLYFCFNKSYHYTSSSYVWVLNAFLVTPQNSPISTRNTSSCSLHKAIGIQG